MAKCLGIDAILPGGQAWAVRIYHKPFIRWIWLGAIFMLAGGLVGSANKRYRRKIKAAEPKATASEGAKA